MDFNMLSTQNWSRMFNVWIEDIQVIGLPAVMAPFEIQSCFMPKVRTFARHASLFVVLLFALHCTSPRVSLDATQPLKAPPGGAPPGGTQSEDRTAAARSYTERGQASWYGSADDGFAFGLTASGERYDPGEFTCAHRTLPFGTLVDVENVSNGRHQVLRVNDRGPFVRGRILDVSRRGAEELGLVKCGVAQVRLRTVDAQGRPMPVPAAVTQGNPFTIQVASLTKASNIEHLSQELQTAFGPVTYQAAQGPGGVLVQRVRVGTYPRLEDAQKASEQLAKFCKDRGLEPFIIRQY